VVGVEGITASLLSVHAILASFTKIPELELTPEEAKSLAVGIAEVNRHYPLPVMKPEHVAIGSLAVTAFVVYRGKFVAVAKRKAREPENTVQVATHDEFSNGQATATQATSWFTPASDQTH
jgi:hypothetical protein